MKILKLLGIVVGLHVVAYLVIMSPGCRSTAAKSESSAKPAAALAPADAPAVAAASPSGSSDLQPIGLNLPLAQVTPPADHYSPTRPGPAAEEIAAEVTPVKSYVVQKGDTLGSIARKNGVTAAALASANKLAAGAAVHPGHKLVIPGKAASASASASAPASSGSASLSSGATYTVKSGDTLSKIASRHGTTSAALRSANGISGDMLKIGQVLQIPGGKAGSAAAQPPSSSAPAAAIGSTPGAVPSSVTPGGKHTVALGESAESIARKYKISVGELARANNITDPRKIRVGQVLTIPGAAGANAARPAASLVPDKAPAASPAAPISPLAPPPGQDLDAGLPPATGDAPVIKVADAPPAVPAPAPKAN